MQRLLDAEELRAALADGRLLPTVLVWQRGMPSWVPAKDVPRLMAGLDFDEPTQDTMTTPHDLGRRAEPTPSIPPAMNANRRRFEQKAGSTMMGIGSGSKTPAANVPKAPKTPGEIEVGAAKPDGGWKEGAAREDDEKTVTQVDPRLDASNRRIGPKAKTLPYSVTKGLGLGGPAKEPPAPSPGPARSGTTKIPPAVGSQEVLSEAFAGSADSDAGAADTTSSPLASSSDRGLRGRVSKRGRARTAKLDDLGNTGGNTGKRTPAKTAKLANAFDGIELGGKSPSPSPAKVKPTRKKTLPKPPARNASKRGTGKEAKAKPAPKRSVAPPPRKRSLPPPPKRSVPPPAPKRSVPPPAPEGSVPPPAPEGSEPEKRHAVPTGQTPENRPAEPRPSDRTSQPSEAASPKGPDQESTAFPSPPALPSVEPPPPDPEPAEPAPADEAPSDAPADPTPEVPRAELASSAPPPPVAIESAPPPLGSPLPASPPLAAPQPTLDIGEPAVGGQEPPSGPLSIATVKKATRDPRVLTGLAAAAVLLGLVAFIVGRATATPDEMRVTVKSGLEAVPLYTRGQTSGAKPSACLMLRAPARLSPEANHRVPFETRTIGESLYIGFARSASLPGGLEVDPTLGTGELVFAPEDEREKRLSRVVPLASDRFGETFADDGGLREGTYVAAEPPFVVAMKGSDFVRRPEGGDPTALWSLPGASGGDAISAIHEEGKGTVLAYRFGDQVFLGTLDSSGEVGLEGAAVAGSGGKVGKPNVATDGRDVSVVFADKPTAPGSSIELRWGHGSWGKPINDASVVELPRGGPGGDAIAPAVAALPGRRWLLMWTEGRPGDRTLRAQTYDKNRRPVGAALRVSPSTGSFGAGTIAVVGDSAVVLFLLATRNGYEVWGTVLQCR